MKGAESLFQILAKAMNTLADLPVLISPSNGRGGNSFWAAGQCSCWMWGSSSFTSHSCCEIYLKANSFVIRKHKPFSLCWDSDCLTRVSSELRRLHLSMAAGLEGRLWMGRKVQPRQV